MAPNSLGNIFHNRGKSPRVLRCRSDGDRQLRGDGLRDMHRRAENAILCKRRCVNRRRSIRAPVARRGGARKSSLRPECKRSSPHKPLSQLLCFNRASARHVPGLYTVNERRVWPSTSGTAWILLIDLTQKKQDVGELQWVGVVVATAKVDVESKDPEVDVNGAAERRSHQIQTSANVNIDVNSAYP